MSFRSSRGVLNPPQYYICLSCRLRHLPHGNYHHQRYQHTTTPQVNETIAETSLESYDSYNNGEPSASAAPPNDQPRESPSQAENITSLPSGDLGEVKYRILIEP